MTKQIKVKRINGDGPSEGFVTRSIFDDRAAKLKTPEGIELNMLKKSKEITKEEFEERLKEIQIPS